MSYKSNKSYILKRFIRTWNFPNPDWEKLPSGFPNLAKTGLTKEEGHLLDAIKLAYFAVEGGWKEKAKKAKNIGLISFICLIGLISLIYISGNPRFTKPVEAATLKVDEIVQSTMSAVLRTIKTK